MGDAIQRQPGWEPTLEQEKMVRDMYLSGAPPTEAAVLMELARARRLNPITKQIYFVKRPDRSRGVDVWSAQVSIDGFRSIAERTGLYDGQDEPEFQHDKAGQLQFCRVRVYRKDWSRPAVGIAYFSEYAQYRGGGELNAMWSRGPHFMLAKCAEACALRKAFPEDLGGLYEPTEIGDDDGAAKNGMKTSIKEVAAAKVAQLRELTATTAVTAVNEMVIPRASAEPKLVLTSEQEIMAKEAFLGEPAPAQSKPDIEDYKIAFGASKGKMVSECNTGELKKLASALRYQIDDVTKSRFKPDNEHKLYIAELWTEHRDAK